MNASSNTRDCAFERYSTATSRRAPPCCDPVADALDDEVRLVALVEGGVEADGLALARRWSTAFLPRRPALFAISAFAAARIDAGRAIVLLEPARASPAASPGGTAAGSRPRAAPAIDRLVVVADDERNALRARDAASSSRTGWRSCPGTRRPARAGSGAGSARAARRCRARARRRAAAARRNRRRRLRWHSSS